MRYQIELMAHNGVAGKNPVEPFAGHSAEITYVPEDAVIAANPVSFDGRTFSYAYKRENSEETTYFFRESVEGEPSDWAKARA